MGEQDSKPIIGITLGDINGVGPEVVMKALADNRVLNSLTPVIYGSTKTLSYYRKVLDLNDFNYSQVKPDSGIIRKKINVVNCWEDAVEVNTGKSTEVGGKCAYLALEKAVQDLRDNRIAGVVTAPINKSNIQNEDFKFPGHTEYFSARFEVNENLMFLVSEELRVGIVTGHIPISEVAGQVTADRIKSKLKIMEKSLIKDFAIKKPKIAVLGLNPHAGDGGLLGMEDEEVIAPVVKELKEQGKLVMGPYPADGFFGSYQHKKFDGVLAMYHDQGLIPFKTIAFNKGVNYTAGLPIVRTSPDHGTAYSLAGKGEADPGSIQDAIFAAATICKNRSELVN